MSMAASQLIQILKRMKLTGQHCKGTIGTVGVIQDCWESPTGCAISTTCIVDGNNQTSAQNFKQRSKNFRGCQEGSLKPIISERCLKRHRWHCSLRSSLNMNDYCNWHGKATSAGQVFCKRRFAPQSSPFWSHLSRLCKMQVLNKGLDMRYHAFFLRLTIAEFQILNTKKSETSEHQHGAYTCGHGRLYLKLLKMKYVMQTRLKHRTGSKLFCATKKGKYSLNRLFQR